MFKKNLMFSSWKMICLSFEKKSISKIIKGHFLIMAFFIYVFITMISLSNFYCKKKKIDWKQNKIISRYSKSIRKEWNRSYLSLLITNARSNWCFKIKQISIPSSVTSIEYNAFKKCSSLKQIKTPYSIEEDEKEYFDDIPSSSTEVTANIHHW